MSRAVPLIDEIRMHTLMWVSDPDFKRVSPALNQALTTLLNEVKLQNALKEMGEELSGAGSVNDEKKKFIAIFKSKFLEYTDFEYTEDITSVTSCLVVKLNERLIREGTNSQEYLNWFFDEWAREERNKKYMPPNISFVCTSWIVDKYIFVHKDSLRIRQKDLVMTQAKNKILEISVRYLEKKPNKDMGLKMLAFSRGRESMKKFVDAIKKYAQANGDNDVLKEFEDINI